MHGHVVFRHGAALAALFIARAVSADSSPAAAEHTHDQPHVRTTVSEWARGAQLYDGLGRFHRTVSTQSAQAQAYFDQGMRLLWAFNHDEATRSFAQAATVDPDCAACYWGVALTVGPNYNLTSVDEVRVRVAFEALNAARAHAAGASAVERALIEALGARYPTAHAPAQGAGETLLAAYAQAMEGVAQRFPDDDDVQVMTAEAEMTVHAWKLWTPQGQPVAGTLVIEARLEAVLKRDPDHPGANHYYVHVMEESPTPQAAVASAERLRGMMPAAGHLEHMPAHIMQRVGRYEDAAEANRRGVSADRAYLASTTPPDYYAMYLAHNSAFLAYSAAMEGRKAETLVAVQDLAATLPVPMLVMMKDSGWAVAAQYAALVRFGLWDELIALEPPDPGLPGATAAYLYGRGVRTRGARTARAGQAGTRRAAASFEDARSRPAGRFQPAPRPDRGRRADRRGAHCRHRAARRAGDCAPRAGRGGRGQARLRRAGGLVLPGTAPAGRAAAARRAAGGRGEGLPRGPETQPRQRLGAVRPVTSRCRARGAAPKRRAWPGNRRAPGSTPMSACRPPRSGMPASTAPAASASTSPHRPAAGW